MAITNKEVIRRLYKEVWNERKLEVTEEIISKSHALNDPTITGSTVGPAAYRTQVRRFVTAFPDLRFQVEDYICDKDRVVATWSICGTHKGEVLGVAATNRKVSVQGITIHQLAGGKILDSLTVWDTYGLLHQIGATLISKAEARVAVSAH
jgi:steroid delta-isomerase-like uncharacterized protein